MDTFTTTVALVGIVIVVASLMSGALERSGLPLVGVFLALGAALGPYGLGLVDIGFESPALHALAMLGLALVLFSDAVTIDLREVRERRPLLWRVLGPGTAIPAGIIGVVAHSLLGVSWPAAAILGGALASTDPVILRSVLRSRAVPETPRTALRIESGMNDVVLLPVVVLAMLAMPTTAGEPAVEDSIARHIVGLFVLGPVLGALVGWLGIILLGRIRGSIGVRRDYESLYALGLAFSGFALAEGAGGSGFLAAFAAGIMVSSQDVELCDCFLEYGEATAEMLLLLTFVALGTSLIWTGLGVIDWRTILFAVVALSVRSVVLYPVLRGASVSNRDRRMIALFGPRGLSSLLLTLLPVFAGVAGSQYLFTVTCFVVLCSVVLHGGGIALFMRANGSGQQAAVAPAGQAVVNDGPAKPPRSELPQTVESARALPGSVPEKIGIDELRQLRSRGDEVIIVDARAERNLRNSATQAAGSVRLNPDDPVRDATASRLSQRATLVVYCA